jgi:hypothetical protein
VTPETFETMVNVGLIVLVGALAAALAVLIRSRLMQRNVEIAVARNLLDDHFRALDKLSDDPAVPAEILEFMEAFSRSVGRKQIARGIASRIIRGEPAKLRPETERHLDELFSKIDSLQSHRKDLYEAVATAFGAGFYAMLMRWPDMEAALAKSAELAITNGPQSRVMAAQVAAEAGNDNEFFDCHDPLDGPSLARA